MFLFLFAVAVVFVATGTCALIEAALYAVRRPYIHRLIEAGHPAGARLESFKEKIDYPITAILIFDTILGVGGAAIAGSQARVLFGESFVYWFTLILAVAILLFAQITPKILGVIYNQPIAKAAALPISISIAALYPVVRPIEFFTRRLRPDDPPRQAIEDDVKQLAKISAAEGSILEIEADLIQNSLKLDDITAQQIMTPMNKSITFPSDLTVKQAFARFRSSSHSRIPIHEPEHANRWTNVIFSRDILFAMANDQFDRKISELARPLKFISSKIRGHLLLDSFLKNRTHLFAVQDNNSEDKMIIGLVTLEDVIEEILGKEIVDEKETHL